MPQYYGSSADMQILSAGSSADMQILSAENSWIKN
jgi:hypothetical protein